MEDRGVTYSLKELFEGVNVRLDRIDLKLDRELEHLESRVTVLESVKASAADVEELKTFKARFLPTSIVVALLMVIGLVVDMFVRFST